MGVGGVDRRRHLRADPAVPAVAGLVEGAVGLVEIDAEVSDRRKRVIVDRRVQLPVGQEPKNLATQNVDGSVWGYKPRIGEVGGCWTAPLAGWKSDGCRAVNHARVSGARPEGNGHNAAWSERVCLRGVSHSLLILDRKPSRLLRAGRIHLRGRCGSQAGRGSEGDGETNREQLAQGTSATAPWHPRKQRKEQRHQYAVEHDGPHPIARRPTAPSGQATTIRAIRSS